MKTEPGVLENPTEDATQLSTAALSSLKTQAVTASTHARRVEDEDQDKRLL